MGILWHTVSQSHEAKQLVQNLEHQFEALDMNHSSIAAVRLNEFTTAIHHFFTEKQRGMQVALDVHDLVKLGTKVCIVA